MRHFFLSLAAASAALLCGIGTAHAVPAKPGLIQVTQSDGTQLTVRLVGDERRHYMLSSDGYTLTGGPDGDLLRRAFGFGKTDPDKSQGPTGKRTHRR